LELSYLFQVWDLADVRESEELWFRGIVKWEEIARERGNASVYVVLIPLLILCLLNSATSFVC
jgi:hypothetical protein